MGISLVDLDRKHVAVELTVSGQERILRGKGEFVHDPQLGECLRIISDDPQDQVEILLRASEWAGAIAVDDRHGCDYRVRLNSLCQLQ